MMRIQNLQFLHQLANFGFVLLLSISQFGCGQASTVSNESTENPGANKNHSRRSNLNISILMDLSDRISPVKYPNATMEYYKRDLGYIESISDAFVNHVSGKKIISLDDRIQTFFDPPPGSQSINALSSQLKFHIDKSNVSKPLLAEISTKYLKITDSIYRLSISDNNYIGSDTWGFFRDKISDYCIRDGYRNILVILTDGYMYHHNKVMKEGNKSSYLKPEDVKRYRLNTSDWLTTYSSKGYGFIPANKNLSRLDVLVLGLNPQRGNPYEKDVLSKYWTDWFLQMGIKEENITIKTAELPSDLDMLIKDFISKRSLLQ